MHTVPLVNIKAQFSQIQNEAEKIILELFRSGNYILGQQNKDFEAALAKYTRASQAIAVKSGTDALILALKAINLQPGDEVITTPFTFIATAEAICILGAKPVFVDIEPETYCIDIQQIAKKITHRTKALLPVHLYGQCVDIDAVKKIATKHNLKVIGDACQSIGAEYKGQPIGGLFDAECYSFFPTKNLGACGEGGAVTSNDEAIADKVKYLRVHGMRERYKHEMIGFNARLDEIQCAILKLKLAKLPGWTARRQAIAADYNKSFASLPGIKTPVVKNYSNHVYHQYTLLADRREKVMKYLNDQGIGTAVHYPIPLHLQEAFAYLGEKAGSYPVAEEVSKKIFSLPVYPELTQEDVTYVIQKVLEACAQ